ncbi:TetR/AcrR family transcriptional regulator [Saccharibacillus qingshengii]|uniref:TetR/AcrR family transcriptional regulator n=1 Tax=Saccharibacillus qingshengii TaxID=1763540 RepID=UPI001553B4D7|nr:TetR/AcrR family transcriptional regulator [Saccharibacillus qingshengii]
MTKQSLRDMKKEETWHVLARTCYELAVAKGLDGFTIEDAVQRARYSRRTFANHFSCKEEAVAMAVLSLSSGRSDVLREVEVPDGMAPLEALEQWSRMQFTAELLRNLRQLLRMARDYPTLEPYVLIVLQRLQKAAQEELDRNYAGHYPPGYTHILAGAVFGAVLSILEGENVRIPGEEQAGEPGEATFEEFLQTTFNYLKNGF